MKTKKLPYKTIFFLSALFTCLTYWIEKSHFINGSFRFITLTLLYSICIILCIVSPLLFIIYFVSNNRKSDLIVTVVTIFPIYWVFTHCGIYYKDLIKGTEQVQSDTFLTDDFSSGKQIQIEYDGKSYTFRLTDKQYDELKDDTPDKSRPAVEFDSILKIYHSNYPVKITYYENTGIITDLEIVKD